jgi:hypothetical protein
MAFNSLAAVAQSVTATKKLEVVIPEATHFVESVAPHTARMLFMKPAWRVQLSLFDTAITVPRSHAIRPNPTEVTVDVSEVVKVETIVVVIVLVAVESPVEVSELVAVLETVEENVVVSVVILQSLKCS